MVNHQVAGDTRKPGAEFAALCVIALTDGDNGLDERLLEDVFGQLAVTHQLDYIVEEAALIAPQQLIKSLIVAVSIRMHQLVVGEEC